MYQKQIHNDTLDYKITYETCRFSYRTVMFHVLIKL